VGETISALSGGKAAFSISNIPAGTYTVIVSKDGYYPLEVSGIPVNESTIEMGMQALCEILLEPQVRFVLLWGETPYDLDLHIVGPASNDDVTSRFMVYYGNESYNVGTNTSIDDGDTEGIFATTSLVQDIYPGNGFYGYGPEAINLYRLSNVQYARGVYCLTVRNYSLYSGATNHDTAWDSSLTSITMRIYDSGGLFREVNFPSDSSLWTGTSGTSYNSWKLIKMTVRGTGRKNRSFKVINEFYNASGTSTTTFDW
jgi:hypothetical protein